VTFIPIHYNLPPNYTVVVGPQVGDPNTVDVAVTVETAKLSEIVISGPE
jgi:hypothetical protein